VDFDNTENLYIEGDNLDVLKLLRENYLNRVKMIYIDPPYNTGNDFIFEDDFAEETEEFWYRDGQYDENGNRLVQNFERNGRFHTDWLNMMYPRLKVARDLLAGDGVIFISIDEGEIGQLRKICDELFGEGNFLSEFPRVTKKSGKSSNVTAKNHDYILLYAKSAITSDLIGISHDDSGYSNKDEHFTKRGYYKLNQTLDYNSLGYSRSLDYPIELNNEVFYPGGDAKLFQDRQKGMHGRADWAWRWSEKLFDFGLKNGFIEVRRGGARPRIYTKTYQKVKIEHISGRYAIVPIDRTKPLSTLEFTENKYSNDNAKKVFDLLMGSNVFEYTKPPELILQLLHLVNGKEFIALDFFSGSATTAHAVMQLNAEDGGKRKFIMVQLPEPTDEKSEAYKAGYKNISEIGKERIRRAGKKIKEEHKDKEGIDDLDIGFRVLKLDSSNMKDVYYTPQEYGQMNFDLEGFMDNIKPDRSDEDLLFQVMLELDIPLSAKINRDEKIFYVNDNYLIACFGKVDTDLITAIAKKKPYYAVFRDNSFASDSALVNFEQVFNTYSPNTIRKVL
jgi:adenine-specific DNA-methyltransferase